MSLLSQRMLAALIGAAFSISASAEAEIAAITSQNGEMLTLFDLQDMTELRRLPLPGKPAAVAVDGARNRVFAIATETAALHVFDAAGEVLAVWPLAGAPFTVAVEPATGMALIGDLEGRIVLINPATGKEEQEWPTGRMPAGIAVEDHWIAFANRDDDRVSLITGDERHEIAVGHHPFGVSFYGGRLFVTNVLSDSLSVIDPETQKLLAEVPTGERPYAVAFAAGKGFVTNQYGASLTVFDAETYELLAEVATDEYPEGIAASQDGQKIVVANWFSDTVQVFDARDHSLIHSFDVPAGPRAFGAFIGPAPANGIAP